MRWNYFHVKWFLISIQKEKRTPQQQEKGTESACAPECQTFGTIVCKGDGSFTFDSIMNESLSELD